MAPPRLQCLNASRQIAKSSFGARALFSTSQSSQADEPPRPRSSAADLLASLSEEMSSNPTTIPRARARDPFANPIQLPQRKQRVSPPALGLKATGSYRVAQLLEISARTKVRKETNRQPGELSVSSSDQVANHKLGQDLSKQITRRWRAGDVYAPHDLSPVEMLKWKTRGRPNRDVFDMLAFNPMEHYKNFSIMSEYMTPMGRIKHSNETGLRPVNQRRIARAIRRSIGMGMMPSVHRHPEILHLDMERRGPQLSALTKGPDFM